MQTWAGKKDWMVYPQISTTQLSTNIHKYPQRSTKISLFFTRVSCRASRVWQETPFFLQHSYRIKISIFFALDIATMEDNPRVWYFFLKKVQFIFYACFLPSRPSLTRNTIFLATQLPNKIFDFFCAWYWRLWKITRVCDIFLKKFQSIFYACFLSSRPSLTRNTIFLATQLANKNFDFFCAWYCDYER